MATLLDRIQRPELAVQRRAATEREVRESIFRNLADICRTRAGTALAHPGYGLPDLTELVHTLPDASLVLARALKHTIEAYEPRLRAVVVRPLPPDPAEPAVRFEITAQLAGRKSPMRMHTAVDPVKGFSFKPA
ncbi:MAG: type VI secretion system baseplate subunit TssE [Polyangiaceae bacterium]